MFKVMQKSACALAVLAVTATSAMATESVDVKVIGTISPSACLPVLSGGGVVDYGVIKADSLSKDSVTKIGSKSVDLTISCDAPTKVALTAVNGRPNTVAATTATDASNHGAYPPAVMGNDYSVVGLGMDGSSKIGGYSLTLTNIMADGVAAQPILASLVNGVPIIDGHPGSWTNRGEPSMYRNSDLTWGLSWATGTGNDPVAFTTTTANLTVDAYLNKGSDLDLSHDIQLDGLTTIELVYL